MGHAPYTDDRCTRYDDPAAKRGETNSHEPDEQPTDTNVVTPADPDVLNEAATKVREAADLVAEVDSDHFLAEQSLRGIESILNEMADTIEELAINEQVRANAGADTE